MWGSTSSIKSGRATMWGDEEEIEVPPGATQTEGVFEYRSNVLRPKTSTDLDNATAFLISDGADVLNNGTRAYFDLTNGSFRAGNTTTFNWDGRGANSVCFGKNCHASGLHSASTGEGNSAFGINSICVGGLDNTAQSYESGVFAGNNNRTEGDQAVIVGGNNNRAKGNYSIITGGNNNYTELGAYGSSVHGGNGQAFSPYQQVFSAGMNKNNGDSQVSNYILRRSTNSEVSTIMYLDFPTNTLEIPAVADFGYFVTLRLIGTRHPSIGAGNKSQIYTKQYVANTNDGSVNQLNSNLLTTPATGDIITSMVLSVPGPKLRVTIVPNTPNVMHWTIFVEVVETRSYTTL